MAKSHLNMISYFSVSAARPGSTLPSRSSIDAPPPVEIHENLSARPRLMAAAAESPPPMIDFTPGFYLERLALRIHQPLWSRFS